MDRKRISIIQNILLKYFELEDKIQSITTAEVMTAVQLTDKQKNKLIKKLEIMTDSNQVNLNIIIDSNLIAGLKIQIGSKVIDASLKNQIAQMAYFLQV